MPVSGGGARSTVCPGRSFRSAVLVVPLAAGTETVKLMLEGRSGTRHHQPFIHRQVVGFSKLTLLSEYLLDE